MSKKNATAEEAVLTEEVTVKEEPTVTEKKAKKQSKAEPANNVSVMYVGPTIEHVVQKSTVFKNGVLPKALNELIEKAPYIKKLLVPIDALPAAMKELNRPNSSLNVISEKVKTIRR